MRFCLEPGCPKRAERAYCPDHARVRDHRRGSAIERGYTWKWTKAARGFLSEFPLCGQRPGGLAPVMSGCYDEQRVTAATEVDHVEPHRGDQVKFWDRAGNWQALCGACHKRKTVAGL
jgi:5-methylcytosine-specific restriction protein A